MAQFIVSGKKIEVGEPVQDPNNPNHFTIEVGGIKHTVIATWGSFTVDDGSKQTCHGHPVLEGQCDGDSSVPSAAVISIIKGPNHTRYAWYTYWKEYIPAPASNW